MAISAVRLILPNGGQQSLFIRRTSLLPADAGNILIQEYVASVRYDRRGSPDHFITDRLEVRSLKKMRISFSFASLIGMVSSVALANGVSNYLPLNLEPEAERQIERVLILADEPVLKRPFAVALVQLALPKACERDKALCIKVKKYLERYSGDYAVTHASATGSKSNGADVVLPNQHGETSQGDWEISAQGFIQPSDYFLASAGVIAYSGRTVPTGPMLSFGFNWAQVDIGYRDHWFSPAPDSTFMIGPDAPTMPSVTLSNYEPL